MPDLQIPPPWRCHVARDADGATRIALAGELDMAVAPKLEAELVRAQRESASVIVDLGELAFVDSSGVHVLLDADLRARVSGQRLLIAHPARPVLRLFELTGVLDRLDVVDASRPASR